MDLVLRGMLLVVVGVQVMAGAFAVHDNGWLVASTHWLVALMALGWWLESGFHSATKRRLQASLQTEAMMQRRLYGAGGLS